MGLFDPGTAGYHRHRRAVTAVALITLAGAAGAAAYTALSAGKWAVRGLEVVGKGSGDAAAEQGRA
jgi:hypothetical protein